MSEVYDVVIVGSGAGGSMAAFTLTQLGARVAVVEAGGHNMDRDIRHHEWPWQQRYRNVYMPDPVHVRLTTKRYTVGAGESVQTILFDGNAHSDCSDDHFFVKIRDWSYTYPEGMPYRWVRARSIGGKTNCWDAGAARWGPIEWKPYSYDGFGIDWPISYDEIAPWYAKTEQLIGVSGERIGKPTDGEFQPAANPTCSQMIMRRTAQRMGYTPMADTRAIITRPLNGRHSCHYCGRCGRGCDTGSKFTAVGTLYPRAFATGRLSLISNAIVREVTVDDRGRANGVSYVDRYTYQEGRVRGRYVVVAASAIETARILLNSKSNRFPNGLANSSGQVGRHLVEDCVAGVSGYLPQLLGREVINEDSYQSGMALYPFMNMDEKSRRKTFLRRYELVAHGGFAMGAGAGHGMALHGSQLKEDVRHWWGASVGVTAAGCGLENPNNFVDIDPEVKDAWGIPAVRIHLKHGPNQEAMVKEVAEIGTEWIERAGGVVTGWTTSPSIPGAQIHEQGLCRMGDDPKKFVTNRWGRSHDVPNLMIADGSLHCTSGITNPTLTILTLSMRNSTHFADEIRKGNIVPAA